MGVQSEPWPRVGEPADECLDLPLVDLCPDGCARLPSNPERDEPVTRRLDRDKRRGKRHKES